MDKLKLITLALCLSCISVANARVVHHYGFEYIESSLAGGTFSLNLIGRYGKNYEKDGKKLLDWSFPYNLQFTFAVPVDNQLYKLEIKNIELIGEETGKHHVIDNIQSDMVRIYETRKLIRVSAGPLTSDKFSYQNYNLTATVIIYENENKFSEEIMSIRLITDYRKEWRIDLLDEIMGV